jgi:hypothetical protein
LQSKQPAIPKRVIIFHDFNFKCFSDFFIHELCQSLLEKLCSFELWKTTQIIHGNVRLHTGRSAYEQHDIFFGIGTSKRINPTDEGFLA